MVKNITLYLPTIFSTLASLVTFTFSILYIIGIQGFIKKDINIGIILLLLTLFGVIFMGIFYIISGIIHLFSKPQQNVLVMDL
jgi:hypothetical protein